MTLMKELRKAIKEGRCPPIFSQKDLLAAGIPDRHHNLSNYDKKNCGAGSENALVSRVFGGETYYALDEAVLDKLSPGYALKCVEDSKSGRRLFFNEPA